MLVNCNSCKREISSEATICPHCGKPDPYTDEDARFHSAIEEHVKRKMSRESIILIVVTVIGLFWGWVEGGGIGAFLGLIIGIICAQLINKVIGWFD